MTPPVHTPITFINQGTYGCVYSPDIKCHGDNEGTHHDPNAHPWATRYISKLQVAKHAQRETSIGQRILTLPHATTYFAPTIDACAVNVSEIDQEELSKCKVVTKALAQDTPSPEFLSSKIRYVGNTFLGDYLMSKVHHPRFLHKRILETHLHLLKGLALLNQEHIVHYDIKDNNILMDEHYGTPILIDFGLSFQTTDLTYQVFYDSYEKYPAWCIDIIFLSTCSELVFKKKTLTLTDPLPIQELETKLEVDIQQNEVMSYMTPLERDQFRTSVMTYLNDRAQHTVQAFMDELIQNNSPSWDNFAVAAVYWFYVANDLPIPKEDQPLFDRYREVLKYILLSFPNRPTPNQTLQVLNKGVSPPP